MYKNNINLNLYKDFYAVAKYGSLSKASKATFTSAPAISKSIKKLEGELNRQLFYRNPNGMELTNHGKKLLYYVEKSYNNLLIAERSMVEEDNLEKGKLSIGMPSNIGSFFLFNKIISFHSKYPNIEITIITGTTTKLIELLETHQIDFVIDSAPINISLDKENIKKKLDTVNYAFFTKKNSIYSNIKSIKELANKPLILPIKNTANRISLDELFEKYQITNYDSLNLHTSEMIISAVKQNLGIGYVIENLVQNENNLTILNIKEELPTVDIILVYNTKYLTTAPQKFIKDYIDNTIEF